MRTVLIGAVLAVLASLPAMQPAAAQSAPAQGTERPRGANRTITREEYVQRASETAGRRFDAMDVNHRGALTRAEMRTWREQHRRSGRAGAERPAAPAPAQ